MPAPVTFDVALARIQGAGYEYVGGTYETTASRLRLRCPKGHEYEVKFSNFHTGRRCPECVTRRPLDVEKMRSALEAEGYSLVEARTYKDVEVVCSRGHQYRIRFGNWSSGSRCEKCYHDGSPKPHTDGAWFLDLVKDAGYRFVQGPFTGVNRKVVVACGQGHKPYPVTPVKFRDGRRCPECAVVSRREKEVLDPKVVREFVEAEGYKLFTEYTTQKEWLDGECPNGRPYRFLFNNFRKGHRCRCCMPPKSKAELEMLEYVKSLGFDAGSDRDVLDGLEIDVYVPSKKVGIEHNGTYWHSEKFRDPDYHLLKLEATTAAGIRLLQFWEDEWRDKRAVVEEIIKRALDVPCRRVGARKCEVKVVDVATRREFLNLYHLQGDARASKAWGLYVGDELLQVLSVRRTEYTGASTWEIARVASKFDVVVVGGLSRLLAPAREYVRGRGSDTLWTFADRRYSLGNSYVKAGFEAAGVSAPGFWYANAHERVHRYTLRKSKDCPQGMTNDDYRASQGWLRLWDCGQLRFRVSL